MPAFLPQVELWTHDRARFPLPPGHRFPLAKYTLLRRRVVELGLAAPEEIHETEPVEWALLERVHDGDLLRRIRDGGLSLREQRGLGLPWSPELVDRGRRSVAGTVEAARHALERGVAMNLGGGTHHAGRAFARGYCLFNDVVVTLAQLRAEGLVSTRWWSTATSTRATAPPTCSAPTRTPTRSRSTARATTRSAHPLRPRRRPADRHRRRRLPRGARPRARRGADRRPPEIAFYLAGADPWEGDRLGRLSLTKAGLRARDALVLDRLRATGAAVCVVLAGGYAEDVRDTVEINAATAAAVAARHGGEGNRTPTSALQRPRAPVITTPPAGLKDSSSLDRRHRRRGLELRHRQPLVRPRGRPDGAARRPARGPALLLPRGAGADPGHAGRRGDPRLLRLPRPAQRRARAVQGRHPLPPRGRPRRGAGAGHADDVEDGGGRHPVRRRQGRRQRRRARRSTRPSCSRSRARSSTRSRRCSARSATSRRRTSAPTPR